MKDNTQKKARLPRIVTPAGTAVYPWLSKPDTKFSPEGKYKITLKLLARDAVPLIEKLEQARSAAYEAKKAEWVESYSSKGKKAPALVEADLPMDENEDGTVSLRFSMTASGTRKDGSEWSQKPALFDAKGQPLEEDTEVWGGSTVKVAFQAAPYLNAATKSAGISLKLNAVQVLKLVQAGGGSAESFGFSSEASDDDSDEGFKDETGSAAGTGAAKGTEDEDF